jgi:decaprenyl-phosphate phosphoribosyltransferase
LALAWVALPVEFLWVLGGLASNVVIYSFWGKHIAIVDVLQVSLGFVLRAVGGAAATGVPLSQWFLAAAMFGSLLMVAGKRASEFAHAGNDGSTRAVLRYYGEVYLRQVMVISAAALLLTYAQWALSDTDAPIRPPWALVSFAPFLYAVLRYVQLSDAGEAEEPERLVLTDRGLQVGGLLWVVAIGIGVYG